MTDRIHSLTVVFDESMRIDDAQAYIDAMMMFSGVVEVVPNISEISAENVGKIRAKQELLSAVLTLIRESHK